MIDMLSQFDHHKIQYNTPYESKNIFDIIQNKGTIQEKQEQRASFEKEHK